MYLICVYMCVNTLLSEISPYYQNSAPRGKNVFDQKTVKKEENAMNKFSLNKTQCMQEGIYIKNIKNQNLASLCPKNCKIHIDKVNYIRDQPTTLSG